MYISHTRTLNVWGNSGVLLACLEGLRLTQLVAGGMRAVHVYALGWIARSSAYTRQQSRALQVEATVCTPALHSLAVLQQHCCIFKSLLHSSIGEP